MPVFIPYYQGIEWELYWSRIIQLVIYFRL